MAKPGILYVTMEPREGLSLDTFHEWYNNEHGPTRLRIPSIFTNGFRYRSLEASPQPPFMAVYDVVSMPDLETPTYTNLRANRSSREAETIGQVDVKRYFYDLLHTKQSSSFVPLESLSDDEAKGYVTVAVELAVKDIPGAQETYQTWYEEEHAEMLSKVPGWLRSRLFRTSTVESPSKSIFFALHDYKPQNGLGGAEHKASMDTPRRTQVFDEFVESKGRATWELFYTFGPAPRELQSLSKLPSSAAFSDATTSTVPGPSAALDSTITTADQLTIPYRLEGNPSPDAPTVAFCNSLLSSFAMWDPLVAILKAKRPDLRILRYDTRGRHAIPSPHVAATLDTVTADVAVILDALRIRKLHTLIGVSMGGATTISFALAHPDRLEKFIAADFNCKSSEANTQAWKDRIATARADNGAGIKILAEQTVKRWMHPGMAPKRGEIAEWLTSMVAANDVEGFAHSCTALWDYDQTPKLKSCKVPGLFVSGDQDAGGAIPKAMGTFKSEVGQTGVELKLVANAGHLPMCEDPEGFWDAIADFL